MHPASSDCASPPVPTHLEVSWLTLWLLLLGTEDYASLEQLESGQAHRRPAEADMVDAAAQLAAVTADVEVDVGLGGGVVGLKCGARQAAAGPCDRDAFALWISCPAMQCAAITNSSVLCKHGILTCSVTSAPTPQELGGLTAEALATPGGEALVARCLQLHERLTALSQLKPPKGSSLAPLVRRS